MKIIAVDDEPKALNNFLRVLREVEPDADVTSFTDSEDAFAYLAENKADIAFLDIKMDGLTGIELAERCKSLCPEANIVFVTGYSQYTMDALRLHVSGYLMKPVRAEDLRTEMENLRYPVLPSNYHRVRVQTFGNFEVFVEGKALRFPLLKCGECLAYLIDRRGAMITVAELVSVLWEDRPFNSALQNNAHKVISNLMKTLKETGVEEIIIRQPRKIGVDPQRVDCDYYRVLEGDKEQAKLFTGKYMKNYSWAEYTTGELAQLINKLYE